MKREVIKTEDGSSTIFIPEMDENYHSTHGAIQEAMHVFIQHGLHAVEDKSSISIFEMGFGTGLNALLTKIHAKTAIKYAGIEAFPVEEELIDQLNYLEELGEEHKDVFQKMHSLPWQEKNEITSDFILEKIDKKIEDYTLEPEVFDLIYFDAFGPKAQSEMWDISILKKMYDGLQTNGFLITYCAMGQFKRDLKSLGFEVVPLPGPPGKREMTKAIKRS